jgi:hypothetical protein
MGKEDPAGCSQENKHNLLHTMTIVRVRRHLGSAA